MAEEDEGAQEAALGALARRAARVRMTVGGAGAVLGVILGLFGYRLVQTSVTVDPDQRAASFGVTLACLFIGFLVPFLAMLGLAWKTWRATIRVRAPHWIEAEAATHRVPPATLRELANIVL
jgi:hypothetical protein